VVLSARSTGVNVGQYRSRLTECLHISLIISPLITEEFLLKKYILTCLLLILLIVSAGCAKKDTTATLQKIQSELDKYEKNMITFYQFKMLPDDPAFPGNLAIDYLDRAQQSTESLKNLDQLAGSVKDANIKKELNNYIKISRKKELLVIKYLDDIRKDVNFQTTGQIDLIRPENDLIVDINRYLNNLPETMLELEYTEKESRQKIDALLAPKKK
jgi:GTPase involved in cell partitioning and DNA repair